MSNIYSSSSGSGGLAVVGAASSLLMHVREPSTMKGGCCVVAGHYIGDLGTLNLVLNSVELEISN